MILLLVMKELKIMDYNIVMFQLILYEVGNESIGCPYSRGCSVVTYIIDDYGNKRKQASLSSEDQKGFKQYR